MHKWNECVYDGAYGYDQYVKTDWSSMSSSSSLKIISAAYGRGDRTDAVQNLVDNGERHIRAKNHVFGDTWPGFRKTLVIVYSDGSQTRTKICEEHQAIDL